MSHTNDTQEPFQFCDIFTEIQNDITLRLDIPTLLSFGMTSKGAQKRAGALRSVFDVADLIQDIIDRGYADFFEYLYVQLEWCSGWIHGMERRVLKSIKRGSVGFAEIFSHLIIDGAFWISYFDVSVQLKPAELSFVRGQGLRKLGSFFQDLPVEIPLDTNAFILGLIADDNNTALSLFDFAGGAVASTTDTLLDFRCFWEEMIVRGAVRCVALVVANSPRPFSDVLNFARSFSVENIDMDTPNIDSICEILYKVFPDLFTKHVIVRLYRSQNVAATNWVFKKQYPSEWFRHCDDFFRYKIFHRDTETGHRSVTEVHPFDINLLTPGLEPKDLSHRRMVIENSMYYYTHVGRPVSFFDYVSKLLDVIRLYITWDRQLCEIFVRLIREISPDEHHAILSHLFTREDVMEHMELHCLRDLAQLFHGKLIYWTRPEDRTEVLRYCDPKSKSQ